LNQTLSEYETKKPTFEHHKAQIVNILYLDPLSHTYEGLTDDQIAKRLELRLREERISKGLSPVLGRKTPTTDNRLRELASESRIVRIKGYDGLKHNFHPDIFASLDQARLRQFFSVEEIEKGLAQVGETK
jgi:hypothetical protein